jgi:hypothetical protein
MITPRAVAFTCALAAIALAAPAAAESASVEPNQHFMGVVNGNHSGAVVYVACPGPGQPGGRGRPTGDQSLAAIRVDSGPGDTGASAKRIVVVFRDDRSARVSLRTYGLAEPIPTSLELPCSGTGKVRFTPWPKGAGAVADVVTVTYENLAV